MAAFSVLAFGSPAGAQHNHIQSSISGQYSRLIHGQNRDAGVNDKATEDPKQQPSSSSKFGSSAGQTTSPKKSGY